MFIPGKGTYEQNGTIYSSIIGELKINMRNKIVNVIRLKKDFPIPNVGQLVNARIVKIRRNSALALMTNRIGINYNCVYEGMIHISQASKMYVESITDAFNEGDIVKAKIIHTDRIPYQLSTIGKKLGVILAYCRICGYRMILKGTKVYCPKCKIAENRKISSYYGKMIP